MTYDELDYLRRKAKLNLFKYITLLLAKKGIKEIPEEFGDNILEYEYKLRFNALQLKNCGDYLDEKATCGIEKYTQDKMNKEMEKEKKLKLTK